MDGHKGMRKTTREIQVLKSTGGFGFYDEVVVYERESGTRYAVFCKSDIEVGRAEIRKPA